MSGGISAFSFEGSSVFKRVDRVGWRAGAEQRDAADEGKSEAGSDEVQSDSMDHDEEYSSESDDVGCDAAVEEQENDTENECTVSYNEDKAAAGTSKLVQPGAISRAPLSNVN